MGRSVPNFEFEDGTTVGELMHGGQAILLDFKGNASLQTLAGAYGDRVRYVSGRAKEELRLNVALIRPDGIIAWASDDDANHTELQASASHWL